MDIHQRVLKFISRFKGAEDTFLHGCCYWFASILAARFEGNILYASPPGHFVCQIMNRLYDITGDVTEEYGDISQLFSMENLKRYEPHMWQNIITASVLLDDSLEGTK